MITGARRIGTRRRLSGRARRLLVLLLPVLVVAAGLAVLYVAEQGGGRAPAGPSPAPADAALAKPAPVPMRREVIPRGGTLADILSRYGFGPKDIHELRERVKPVYDLGKIVAGREIRVRTTPEGGWSDLEYDIDGDRILAVRNDAAGPRAVIRPVPYELRPAFLWAVIEDSPIAAVNAAGEDDFIALELADIFGSDIDFYTDLRRGDRFRVVFEKKLLDGKPAGYGRVLAAEFVNQEKVYRAFRFTYPDTGRSDWFDPAGGSLRKEFLKSPMKFARITSRFSRSRLHPIRKIYRPHNGVDYAAPVGSPVQATADGTVTQAGWNGAAGRMIKLRHANAYETMYLHLSGFARGIRVGAKVAAKQVIGYVGTSGESTGPHLDYRILYHGKYVNPLGWKFQPAEPLRKEFLEPFKAEVEKLSLALDAPAALFGAALPPGHVPPWPLAGSPVLD